MQETHVDVESRRTAALALWRYSHDYLKAAQALCESNSIACNESQAPYHLAAQGIEFALKSFLRARGVTPEDLNLRIRHSLPDALQEALAHGLSAPPVGVARAIRFIAPHHRDDQFRYFVASHGEFPDLAPLLRAGTWILGEIAAEVVADYFVDHGHRSATASDDMLRRLQVDLELTASRVRSLQQSGRAHRQSSTGNRT
jgi:hypothetical protein